MPPLEESPSDPDRVLQPATGSDPERLSPPVTGSDPERLSPPVTGSNPERLSPPVTGAADRVSASLRQPWLSAEADSSNPETLYELPLGGLQSGVADPSPSRSGSTRVPPAHRHTESRQSESSNRHSMASQRMSELRSEMRAHQAQIQQLTEANQAVHNAVSGINATQELLRMAPQKQLGESEMMEWRAPCLLNPESQAHACSAQGGAI